MSGAGFQPAIQSGGSALLRGRSLLAHLLHALNQPLTGLQCSLELAVAGPRATDQYVETLRASLDLASRMRELIAAIRELMDIQDSKCNSPELILFDTVLREVVAELLPVAEAKHIRLRLEDRTPHPVWGDRSRLTALTFRLLDSALSLTVEGGALEISARNEREQAQIMVSWVPGPPTEHSPFSPPELGLLIAQAGWEQSGAEWLHARTGQRQSCTFRLPLASFPSHPDRPSSES
jgi:signal transduction histidine kinase